MYFNRILFIMPLILFGSCDCLQIAQGTVYDKATGKPLDSVLVYRDAKDLGEYSDKKGEFRFDAISGGLCGCPPLTVTLTKPGYQDKNVSFKAAIPDKVYLEREK